MARAKAEERRSVAIAREQEMKAAVSENRARLLEAEALVPKSIGEAYRAGRIERLAEPASGQARLNRRSLPGLAQSLPA